jgi:hypothetical protein
MEPERADIRPHMKLGLILIGIGGLNALTGWTNGFASQYGGTLGSWSDKAVWMALIAFGIWNARRKILVDNGAVLFVWLVPGRWNAEVMLKDVDGVSYDPARRAVIIKAKDRTLRVRLGPKSKARGELYQALKDRGVAVEG